MKLIATGAEAEIYDCGDFILKRRVVKEYRISEIDTMLNKSRTKRESNIIQKLNDLNIPSPKFIKKENYDITMEKINGEPIKKIIHQEGTDSPMTKNLMVECGKILSDMHRSNIIHGDLTTLNFLFNEKVFIIDFGLSSISHKDEDKATDLYLFEKSLACAHSEDLIEMFYEGYEMDDKLKNKLEEIRKRGRKRD